MDSPDRRRRKRRFLRQTSSPLKLVSPARLRFLFLSFICLLSVFWYGTHLGSYSFRPVLRLPRLPLLPSSSSTADDDFDSFRSPLRIWNRVFFPGHVLLLVGGGKSSSGKLECVYSSGDGFYGKGILSYDEYDEFRWAVRCPLPSSNESNSVGLRWRGKGELLTEKSAFRVKNQTADNWGNLVYAAVVDVDDVVVFVKGLNLRPDRESNPSPFTCYFEVENWEGSGVSELASPASMAAQELVRCPLPTSIVSDLNHRRPISVTIGVTLNRGRRRKRVLMPSAAAVIPPAKTKTKYELCVCTMVWNQASSIKEWIMYHSWLGVERWFIYDNNSDDGISEILQELDSHNITRHFWPWIKTQEAGFSHCALKARDQGCAWVSFMDVDEFFYFPYSSQPLHRYRPLGYASRNSLLSLVSNFTSSSQSIAEIRTSCYSFGPSGLSSQPEQGVTAGYTCRLQSPERHKSIIRPEALDPSLLNVVHHFHLKEGFRYLDLPRSVAVINHYKYQVWEVFRAKFYRRVATYVADWGENQNEGSRDRAPGLGTEAVEPADWTRRFCEVWDTGLRDFVVANFADSVTGMLPWGKSSASA